MPVAVSVHEVDSLPSVFLVIGIPKTVVYVANGSSYAQCPFMPQEVGLCAGSRPV
jgi:hypothetical protein